uniref:Uncharacterized protein n=2 Tax=Caprinae TaxID=9963 RepID=A0AC11CMA6_SHEEP
MQKSPNSDIPVETLNPTRQGTGAVQMRIKNANSHHDRLSQSKSMILTDAGKVTEPISRHRRNHSQHVLKDVIPPLEQLMVEKEGYLQKAKIADGGKKLRKNWSTSWIVLSSRKIEFYKESKQQALSNMILTSKKYFPWKFPLSFQLFNFKENWEQTRKCGFVWGTY